ncbi:DUF2185 domain-containing protein [Pedobacter metabolipauper]|uniref:Immunity protein Imm33 domain-containing protein n=1 Tax=Pedobacter metabolipauper TaxID=425513 RepID=A0A4R6SU11_9SPHI|nr:DUF2185 domain-containing protein [Pedobacter metabolipauper]TDQ08260.1 hypothetical protein ATK78_2768 [Pedobacter metabolipauper]
MNSFKEQDQSENNFDNFLSIGGLMVSKMVADEQIKPRFMYREKRTRPEDSGWRIFTGFETEEYTDDPDNTGIYNPSTILKIDPSIAGILLKGIGSVYERIEDDGEWYKVTDFEMEDDYMVTHRITEKWVIEINNLFERRIEEGGELFYTTGDKSVRIVIWNEADKDKEALYVEHKKISETRDQTIAITLETFDFSDDEVARIGYLIQEEDENKTYGVIYGFSIIDNQIVQVVVYFDDDEDLNWAIETWKNIKLVK